MLDRRFEPRTLCADNVSIEWVDRSGRSRRALAFLEDISRSGARLLTEHPVPVKSELTITHPMGQLKGKVRNCKVREAGYNLGIEFDAETPWSPQKYRPRHFHPLRIMWRSPSGRSLP